MEITTLLSKWGENNREALDQIINLAFFELKKISASVLSRFQSGKRECMTLCPTSLTHMAYIKLTKYHHKPQDEWVSRKQFYGLSKRIMLCILLDHQRSRKRNLGSMASLAEIPEVCEGSPFSFETLIGLDQALKRYRKIDPRGCRIVEMYFLEEKPINEITLAVGLGKSRVYEEINAGLGQLKYTLNQR